MPTIEVSVAASADDCIFYENSTPAWVISLTSAYVYFGRTSGVEKQGSGLRFLAATIPADYLVPATAIIDASYFVLKARGAFSATTVNAVITGNKEASPAAWGTVANYQSRRGTIVGGADDSKITTAHTHWDSVGVWTDNNTYQSPDFSPVVQEMVDDLGELVNAAFFIDDHAATSSAGAYRGGSSFNDGDVPVLWHIEYHLPVTAIVKIAAESIGLTEGDLEHKHSIRFAPNTVSILNGSENIRNYASLVASEVVGLNEASIRRARFITIINEALGLADTLLRRFRAIQFSPDGLGITEALARRARSLHLTAESVGIPETLVKRARSSRLANEAVGIAEGFFRRAYSTRIFSETLGITEAPTITGAIAAGELTDTLVDFPVYVKLAASAGKASTDITHIFDVLGANYLKMHVLSGGQECYCEVVSWDESGRVAELWIRLPSGSTAGTQYQIKYDASWPDNTAYVGLTGSTPGKAVWDAGFVAVVHANDLTTSTVADSTTNSGTFTKFSAGHPAEAAGSVGKAQLFSTTENMYSDNSVLNITGAMTIEMLANLSAINTITAFFLKETYQIKGYFFWSRATGQLAYRTNQAGQSQETNTAAGVCVIGSHNYAVTRSGATASIYKDGVDVTATHGNHVDPVSNTGAGYIGTGIIGLGDEVRISNVARSPAWIAATNKSLTDTLATYSTAPDASVRRAWAIRLIDEAVGITENVQRWSRSIRMAAEAVGISETFIRRARSIRFINEVIGIVENVQRRFWSIRQMVESIGIIDAAIKKVFVIGRKAINVVSGNRTRGSSSPDRSRNQSGNTE